MPRYYFDVDDGRTTFDDVGAGFEDVEAAHLEALRLFGALIEEEPGRFRGCRYWEIGIRTEAQRVVRRISLLNTHQDFPEAPARLRPSIRAIGAIDAGQASAGLAD